jgi:surface protein
MFNPIQFYLSGAASKPFISTWKTDNLSAGSTLSNQIKLPLSPNGNYRFLVDWGDGSSNIITTYADINTTHTYSVAGTYTVKITGLIAGMAFGNTGDRLKLLSITQWGSFILGTIEGSYFYGCSNLTLDSVTDVLNLSGRLISFSVIQDKTTSLTNAFRDCTSLTTINRMDEWDTSEVTLMSSMFQGATLFNQYIGSWNTSSVTNPSSMFTNASSFNQDISAKAVTVNGVTYTAWDVSNVTNFASMFQFATSFNQPIINWKIKTTGTVSMTSMFGTSGFNQDISTKAVTVNGVTYTAWDTSAVNSMNSTFLGATAFNQNIGNWNTSSVTIMTGTFSDASSFNQDISTKAVTVNGVTYTAWNTSAVTTMSSMLQGTSFNQNIGNWNTSSVINMSTMFRDSPFNQDISTKVVTVNGATYTAWDVSAVGPMNSMFLGATAFNQSLNSWNTDSATNMSSMFLNATGFNNGLSVGATGTLALNTSSVTTFSSMFFNAESFNQNVGSWNVSSCGDFASIFYNAFNFNNGGSSEIGNWRIKTTGTVIMLQMFRATAFNHDISTKVVTVSGVTYTAWDVSAVTSMSGMFNTTTTFNQPLNSWNTSSVTNMSNMFLNATSFNNGLSVGATGTLALNTSSVTTFVGMFSSAESFNQNIGSWNVSSCGDFTNMFSSATTFNNGGSSEIGNWKIKTTGTVNMQQMFRATAFNQDISTKVVTVSGVTYTAWDVSAVTNMISMFNSATAFNQPLNSWNVSAVTNMASMFLNASTFNQPLNSWNTSNVTIMSSIFSGATNFNQNIGSWNVSKVTTFVNFMNTKTPLTFSTTNLDAIYNGWSTRPVLASKVISFGSAKRTAASTAGRAILTGAPNLWTITDGGI